MSPSSRKVALYFGVTFTATHVLSVAYLLAGGSWGSPSSFAVANAFMLVPAVVAVGLQRFVYRQLMYYVVLKSLVAAIRGGAVGWNKFERTGTARIEGEAV